MKQVATAEAVVTVPVIRGRVNLPQYLRGRSLLIHGTEVELSEVPGQPQVWLVSSPQLKQPATVPRKYVDAQTA